MNPKLKKIYLAIIFLWAILFLVAAPPIFAYNIKVGLPVPGAETGTNITDPGQYIRYLFIFGMILISFLAVGMLVIGGITYMLSSSLTSVEKAKAYITGALTGVGLLLVSYVLLNTIDPNLTNLTAPKIEAIDMQGYPHEAKVFTPQQIQSWNATGANADLINAAALKYNIDPNLIKAVIMAESGGDPNAVSNKGAQGLMQIMPGTQAEVGITKPFDPAQSIDGGAKYLATLNKQCKGDLQCTIGSYNAGYTGYTTKCPGSSCPKQTQQYVPKVTEYYNTLNSKT